MRRIKAIICDYCSRTFNRKWNLMCHIQNCHSTINLQCHVCKCDFNSEGALRGHMLSGHNSKNMPLPECHLCTKVFSRKHNMVAHMVTTHLHKEKTKCESCSKSFSTVRNCRRHYRSLHNPNAQFPTCNDCNKPFKSKQSLASHIKSHCNKPEIKTPNTCEVCEKMFTSNRNLKRHSEMHTNREKSFNCKLCPKVYTSNQSLRRHTKLRHDPDQLLHCTGCSQTYPSHDSLELHEKSCYKEILYKCNHCEKKFTLEHKLKEHTLGAHNKFSLYKCPQCIKQFVTEVNLREHIKNDHENSSSDSEEVTSYLYNCEFCSLVFDEVTKLKTHMSEKHGKELCHCFCNVCYKKFYAKESLLLHKHQCSIPRGTLSCKQCEKLFTERCSLDFHTKVFHSENDVSSTNNVDELDVHAEHKLVFVQAENAASAYNCLQCERVYNSDRSLKHHIKLKHSADEVVECNICGKMCSNKYYLSSHLKIVHTTETISKCDYCEKLFKSKRNIRRHIEYTHLGIQKYKCIECNTLFKEKRSLRKHIRMKHPQSLVFPKCQVCTKLFESVKSCKIHLKLMHSVNEDTHACDLCPASFGSYQAFNQHLRTHHMTDTHKCRECNVHCADLEELELHMARHAFMSTRKILPRCVICVKDFSTRKTLKRHVKKFHTDINMEDLIDYGLNHSYTTVECDECIRKFSEDIYHDVYEKQQHLRESVVFTCGVCDTSYNTVEYSIQRCKVNYLTENRTDVMLSELCTAELSEEQDEGEIQMGEMTQDMQHLEEIT